MMRNPLEITNAVRASIVGRQSRFLDDDQLTDKGLSDRIMVKERNHKWFEWAALIGGVIGGASVSHWFVRGGSK